MSFPKDVKYTKDHEWLRVEGNEAYVGITHFAQSELGDIVFIDVDTEGESLEKEEVFGSVEAVKTVSDLFMPINGEVLEFNENLEDNPELINKRLYFFGSPKPMRRLIWKKTKMPKRGWSCKKFYIIILHFPF